MTRDETVVRERRPRGGVMYVARSRGMLSGLLLVLLGLWGALIPFVGPYFSYAYTPDRAWAWTAGRLWLEILPGAAAIVGGLMLMGTAHRAIGVFAGWLASAAGAWFVVGPILSRLWNGPEGSTGTPIGGTSRQVFEQIGFFSGLGVVILFLAAQALGRFTVRSVRDVAAAETVRRTTVAEPTATRPVAGAPVTTPAMGRERTTPVAGTERERTAEFEGNRVAAPPAETVEAAPGTGEGATRMGHRTP
jgi:hypothetical protein